MACIRVFFQLSRSGPNNAPYMFTEKPKAIQNEPNAGRNDGPIGLDSDPLTLLTW